MKGSVLKPAQIAKSAKRDKTYIGIINKKELQSGVEPGRGVLSVFSPNTLWSDSPPDLYLVLYVTKLYIRFS